MPVIAATARKLKADSRRLEGLAKQAMYFGTEDFEQIQALSELHGPDAGVEYGERILNDNALADHPFARRNRHDIENPHVHLLRTLRDPEYFPLTCKLIFGIDLFPFQHAILKELWVKPFPMLIGSRGMGKSFILALYAMLRALLCQGVKIVIVGAAFRQAKVVFEYCESIWSNAPVLRDLVGGGKGRNNRDNGPRRDVDRCEMILGESLIMALPLGDGKKIRGQRANYIIADEFASIPEEIYENVVAGFAAVSSNPVAMAKNAARIKLLKSLGLWTAELDADERKNQSRGNQAVLSGTAYYAFNHFAKYWRNYKAFIESRGDPRKLKEIFGGDVPASFNWRDYSIIRIPVWMLPDGFMDAKHVARSKATVHSGIFQMEFGACFATDSDGFFRRSLIESCVIGSGAKTVVKQGGPIKFDAALEGDKAIGHVIGVDPASQTDNFAIVVLALYADHARVVYSWTTNNVAHKEKLKRGIVSEHDFYAFGARKIRELMKAFPTARVVMDAQGGGRTGVYEALKDPARLLPDEQPIYEIIDQEKEKETDHKPGLHILELVEFADAKWTFEANHGLRFDFEHKNTLFPAYNSGLVALALEADKEAGRIKIEDGREVVLYDTLEDIYVEIEALKDELATIVHSQTNNGRDRWDTPETKVPGSKKGHMRKDRYSALLMANSGARKIRAAPPAPAWESKGGWAKDLASKHAKQPSGPLYVGPDWFMQGQGVKSGGKYGAVVRRK